MQIDRELAEKHYAEHIGKSFFEDLIGFITSGPVFAMVLEGDDAIATARRMMGKTNPLEADPGTIRADYAIHTNRNVIHGSDSPESAQREIQLFFAPDEILSYQKAVDTWI
ncbi:multifunctional nucleoside diphosphate kinase/apyrimidinic endonuclease/3'-phosphodiesterase [Listeria monocytogenes FSL F6-684]|nr:multifunctional nucleoside diphosphate kinase/apyrimidinic endonuclease/3'-phosphodiesterase [Listeria monocytogenes FSL F6-684]